MKKWTQKQMRSDPSGPNIQHAKLIRRKIYFENEEDPKTLKQQVC